MPKGRNHRKVVSKAGRRTVGMVEEHEASNGMILRSNAVNAAERIPWMLLCIEKCLVRSPAEAANAVVWLYMEMPPNEIRKLR